jgi:Holliday junction resolvase-like predicted endonuclease
MGTRVHLKEDGTRERPISETPHRKGDMAEYYAVTWLWDNGYEVFPNAGCSGPIDIIAFKDGEITLIDVKTERKDWRWPNAAYQPKIRTQEQKNIGVVFLAFNPDTRKLRWVNHR